MLLEHLGGKCRLVAVSVAVALLSFIFVPVPPAAAEQMPLISRMPGPLKLECRAAENVEACGFVVEALIAYFHPAYQFERRFVTGAKVVLGLRSGPPSEAACNACIFEIQYVEAYIAAGTGWVPPPGMPDAQPPLSNLDRIGATLKSVCDKRFRSSSAADQCKAELDYYVPLVADFVLDNYPPLAFCRSKPVAVCPLP
jgi:hypothetical protein